MVKLTSEASVAEMQGQLFILEGHAFFYENAGCIFSPAAGRDFGLRKGSLFQVVGWPLAFFGDLIFKGGIMEIQQPTTKKNTVPRNLWLITYNPTKTSGSSSL